jgi:hypothetical protein
MCLEEAVPSLLLKEIKIDHVFCLTTTPADWSEVFGSYNVRLHDCDSIAHIFSSINHILRENNTGHIHILGSDDNTRHLMTSLPGVAFFSSNIKWTLHTTGTYRKWMKAGSEVIIDGPYTNINGEVRLVDDRLEICSDGVIEVDGLNSTWLGEIFRV